MELLMTILFYVAIWFGAGVLANLLKMFVFFRGPIHMLTMYISHPDTRKSGLLLLQLIRNYCHINISVYLCLTTSLAAGILAPLAIVELLLDVIRFFNYTPPKEGTQNNEQK